MPKLIFALLISCLGRIWAGETEIKYNIVGSAVPQYSEQGFEMEHSQNTMLIPFMRLALINREYEHESWEGETVGKSTEDGFQVLIGNKIRPFNWGFTRNLEFLLFYRQSQIEFTHASLRGATGEGREKVRSKAIGTGLSLNIAIGKWIVVEPFWYGDYGRYDIEKVYGNTFPNSPYLYKWDDEHRVGINIGLKL